MPDISGVASGLKTKGGERTTLEEMKGGGHGNDLECFGKIAGFL
jgi:hypothetical protein